MKTYGVMNVVNESIGMVDVGVTTNVDRIAVHLLRCLAHDYVVKFDYVDRLVMNVKVDPTSPDDWLVVYEDLSKVSLKWLVDKGHKLQIHRPVVPYET